MGLGELEAGDALLSRYGLVTVAQVTSHPAAPVYNISVQQLHVYEVTEWGILTHNTCFVISPAEGGGYNVLRDGKVIKTFKSGDDLADKAAAKAYRRNAEKVAEKEAAAAAKLTRAAKLAAEVRDPIDGEEYIAEFVGEAEDFLASHKTLNEKFMRAARKGVVAKRSKTGVVASEKPEYDYKIKILGTGGNFRLYGKIIGNRIIFDTYDTHD